MPKKTARRPPSPERISSAIQTPGLIAKAEMPKRSARTKCALDNRSHRTDSVQLRWSKQYRAVDASKASASARSLAPLPAANSVRQPAVRLTIGRCQVRHFSNAPGYEA